VVQVTVSSDTVEVFRAAEASIRGHYASLVKNGMWLDCPMIVSIETYAKCNAACDFCPYPELLRQGERLETQRVIELINEVAEFPRHPQRMNLSRVNEPFLDPRIFEFLDYASRVLPQTELVLFSNGQTITDRTIDRLNAIATFKHLSISFNEYDAETYRQVMGLDQAKTLRHLRHLHERAQAGSTNFSVSLSRVGTSDAEDQIFLDWCRARFPLFPVASHARFNWVGMQTSHVTGEAPDAGCAQWFSLHVLANGQYPFCCIDGVGELQPEDNSGRPLLEIYNTPLKRRLRETITSRRQVKGCEGCLHAMPSLAYRA